MKEAKSCKKGQIVINGKCRYPERYAVFWRHNKGKSEKQTWALPKWEAQQFAKHIKEIIRSDRAFKHVKDVKVKKLSDADVKKDVMDAKKTSSYLVPDSLKELIYLW